jgi:hypothetical protein
MISSNPVVARSWLATVLSLVIFALLGSSATSAPNPAQEREIAAQKHIENKLQIWQERLNLKDWNIRARLVHPDSLEPKTLGNINWDTDKHTATIGVLSTYNYELPYQAMLEDMEFTIVHELVHLHLASLPRSEASRRVEEHAVNELSKALLNLAKH